MVTADFNGRLRQANAAFFRMLGYSAEELAGLCYLDIVHKDDREECERQSRAAAAGEISYLQLEGGLVRKSGDAIWVRVNISPIGGHDGRVLYTLGIIEKIDERRHAKDALQQVHEHLEQRIEERTLQLTASEARLQAHFQNSPDWLTLFRATKDGAFTYEDLNPATERAYGLTRDRVIGRRLEEVLGDEPAQLPLRHMPACLRTGENQRYIARRTMAGVTRTIDVLFVLVPERPIAIADRGLMALAGLWENWRSPAGEQRRDSRSRPSGRDRDPGGERNSLQRSHDPAPSRHAKWRRFR
jgi:PAS domain S-box-containing protein